MDSMMIPILCVQPAATRPRPWNIIIDSGPRMTRDISSQHILAGKRLRKPELITLYITMLNRLLTI